MTFNVVMLNRSSTWQHLVLNNIQWLANNFTAGEKKNPLFCKMIHSQTTKIASCVSAFCQNVLALGANLLPMLLQRCQMSLGWTLPWHITLMMSTSSEAICWDNLLMVEESSFSKCPAWRIQRAIWYLSSRELSCESVTMPTLCQLYQSHFPELSCQFHL